MPHPEVQHTTHSVSTLNGYIAGLRAGGDSLSWQASRQNICNIVDGFLQWLKTRGSPSAREVRRHRPLEMRLRHMRHMRRAMWRTQMATTCMSTIGASSRAESTQEEATAGLAFCHPHLSTA